MHTSIELFAGAGGLALGIKKAGFSHIALFENNNDAYKTLILNGFNTAIINDVSNIDFSKYIGTTLVSGGFPCQSFSHAGKRTGLNDVRGTLFFEFARAIKEVQPRVFLGENVKGLTTHDSGKTINTIKNILINDLGYFLIEPFILNASDFNVAQNRERLFLIGFKSKDDFLKYKKPTKLPKITLKDIFFSGKIYSNDVPQSDFIGYSEYKKNYLKLIPQGKNWKSLPIDKQKEYLGNMFFSGGGKTGILKRLSYDEQSPTIMCSPSQKQTERCHPTELRPLTIRESARIQSFPDEWVFCGSKSSQYKQIGNAVPVNLAYYVGLSIFNVLEDI